MSKVLITQEIFNNMDFDTQTNILQAISTATSAKDGVHQSSLLIVFANSDINAALYHLNKSLTSPFDQKAIATVLVQESIKEDFVYKIQKELKPFVAGTGKSYEQFVKVLDTAKKLNAQLITIEKQNENLSPTLVCDFTHEQLSATAPSGIVTLHTFRTAKEAIALVKKESLNFTTVSLWHENHGYAYEFVAALKSNEFFINCHQVALTVLEESIAQGKNYVILDTSYHYETLQHDGVQKSVVFPIGSIFAN